MLILSRKKGQKLIINDNIEIVIIEADSGIAKIGIEAPKEVPIYREELYKELKTTNKTSTTVGLDEISQLEKELKDVKMGKGINSFGLKIKKND